MRFRDFFKPLRTFLPASTDFGHLYSEYLALEADISDGDKKLLEEISARGNIQTLAKVTPGQNSSTSRRISWDDIYTFELILLKYRPLSGLRNKVISLRDRYLNTLETKFFDIEHCQH